MKPALKNLITRWSEYDDTKRAAEILEWDQETYLPAGGAPARANHLSTLAGISHEKLTSKEFKAALNSANKLKGLPVKEKAMVREAKRTYDRAAKTPAALVKEIAHTQSEGLAAWKKARQGNKWSEFADVLTRMVRLQRRVADCVGYQGVPYDALMDSYEPDATVKELDPLFEKLKEATVPLVRKIAKSKKRPDRRILTRKFPKEDQVAFGRMISEKMGFNFECGRMDMATHPFCTSFDPGDVRLTFRVDERDLRPFLFGLVHETGHGLYEQGLDKKLVGTPVGQSNSLGIHESQSRLWENVIGRSKPFWKHFFPKLRKQFPQAMKGVSLNDLYFAMNEVTPSFIRVEADEVTYNLHIVLRYELEKGLLSGKIQPKNLPKVWNQKMKDLLGITPPTDSVGVLQDIHWGMGLFGYFPTYSLGNIYAAQFYERIRKDIRNVDKLVENGKLLPIREWLKKKIHAQGRIYSAAETIRRATGKNPTSEPFVTYINEKFGALYDL